MGFTTTDLHPDRITAITPPGKCSCYKLFEVASDEVATEVVKVALPAQTSVVGITAFANDAGGTGDSITISIEQGGVAFSTGTYNLETDGATGGTVAMTNLPNMQSSPAGGDIYIKTTSTVTAGGPWKFLVEFVA